MKTIVVVQDCRWGQGEVLGCAESVKEAKWLVVRGLMARPEHNADAVCDGHTSEFGKFRYAVWLMWLDFRFLTFPVGCIDHVE